MANKDEYYMQRCLTLALKGLGAVAPNPMVGAVLVYNDTIIGEGYHQAFGEAHAEVNALASVSAENIPFIAEATMYVNLEPCSHYGKTPPCADLLIAKKVKRVVIGSYDPNPQVAGRGIEKLLEAGIEVSSETLKKECDFLNRSFLTYHTLHRPYITLKWAQSADGFIGLKEPKQFWFTNETSKQLTHKWRTEQQAILVGRNTIAIDDSELTARLWKGKNPTRIVLDKNLTSPTTKKIFNTAAITLVFNALKTEQVANIHYIQLNFSSTILTQVLQHLYKLQIQSLMVEGGAETIQAFITQNLWNEAQIFTTKHILNDGIIAPKLYGKILSATTIDTDLLETILNTNA